MTREYEKTDCPLHGSEYCEMINMQSCATCTIAKSAENEPDSVKADLDAVKALLPEGGVSELFDTDECRLCKGESKNARTCYARVDMANAEPKRKKTILIGIKVKSRIGSIIPIQVACCDECRKRANTISGMVTLISAVAGVASIVLISIRGIREPLAAISPLLPFALFALLIGGAYIAAKLIRKRLIKQYSELTCLDIFDIPLIQELRDRGWFVLSQNGYAETGGITQYVFSQKRIERGLMTGVPSKVQTQAEKSE